MKLRPLFRAFTLLSFGLALGVGGLGIGAAGCGQDVASCANVCPSGSSDALCPGTCTTIQTACDSANAGADFQALLTCVANASGAISPLPELCAADYAIVQKNCGALGEIQIGTDGGTTDGG